MTTLTVTLAMKGCLPGVPLWKISRLEDLTKAGAAPGAVVILGRDILLVLAAFKIRYTSLPPPVRIQFYVNDSTASCLRTFSRYWDFSIPLAGVRPTEISNLGIYHCLSTKNFH